MCVHVHLQVRHRFPGNLELPSVPVQRVYTVIYCTVFLIIDNSHLVVVMCNCSQICWVVLFLSIVKCKVKHVHILQNPLCLLWGPMALSVQCGPSLLWALKSLAPHGAPPARSDQPRQDALDDPVREGEDCHRCRQKKAGGSSDF